MSCKSALYAANSTAQSLTANNVVSFGNIVRRYGCAVNLLGGNAILKDGGYYDIDANFTMTGTSATAATVTIALYKDGVAVPGATTSATIDNTASYSVTIPAIVRKVCPCTDSTITAVISGAASVTNAAIVVKKL